MPPLRHGLAGAVAGSYTLTAAVSDLVDDHADSFAEATSATVGEAVEGVLDYAGDVDVFAVALEAGRLYQVDVALGTLPDSVVTLFGDGDEGVLASNDDHGDSPASRIYWETSSGTYLVEVASGRRPHHDAAGQAHPLGTGAGSALTGSPRRQAEPAALLATCRALPS